MIAQAQLPLNIQLRDEATFKNFYPGNNAQAVNAVIEVSQGQGESFLYLWGSEKVGKSHLLQAACHGSADLTRSAVYIPLSDIADLSFQVLQGLEKVSLVCLDDLQCLAGKPAWEEALFHLFNRIRAGQGKLLIAADCSPKQIDIQLPDLKSRLAWGVTYHLHDLSDEEKLAALQWRARCRGLELNKTVGKFLLSRCSRDIAELFQILEALDHASLAEQHRLTIPFVKQILKL